MAAPLLEVESQLVTTIMILGGGGHAMCNFRIRDVPQGVLRSEGGKAGWVAIGGRGRVVTGGHIDSNTDKSLPEETPRGKGKRERSLDFVLIEFMVKTLPLRPSGVPRS